MAGELSNELLALHACLKDSNSHVSASKAHDIVGNIGLVILHDVIHKNAGYVCSQLFDKEHGCLEFLRKTSQLDEHAPAKIELFMALTSFMKKFEKVVLPYAVDIQSTCYSVFLRDRLAKVKNVALLTLLELLSQAAGSKISEDLRVKDMIEKYFMEVGKTKSSTVKQTLLHLLGVMTEVYPQICAPYADRFFDVYIRTLKMQMTSKTKKPEFSVIAGCLLGLTSLLLNFTQSVEEGAKYSFDIYSYCKKAIDSDIKHSRYEMPKAGLQLLAKHSPQFNQYLLDDHQAIYDCLSFWSSHHNRDMMHSGMAAMESFLTQISEMLVADASKGRKNGSTFKFFIKKFRSIMDTPESSNKEISLAIKGYGAFAAPCKLFLTPKDVKFMFSEMIQRSEQVFFGDTEGRDEEVFHLPSFLEALASIVRELDDVSDIFLISVERLVVVLMANYPKLSKKMYFICFVSLLKLFFALAPKGAIFRGFLSRVVYQSLLRTCSHPVTLETAGQIEDPDADSHTEDGVVRISYKDYLEMWFTLLDSARIKELAHLEISLEERHRMTEAIYDELVIAVMKILERLDLTSNKSDDQEHNQDDDIDIPDSAGLTVTSDPVHGLQATRPKDFIVFINLVSFTGDLLPHKQTLLFKKWIFTFGHKVITHSTKYPHVSGFYKLLSVCLKICTKVNYFNDVGDYYKEHVPASQEDEDSQDVVMQEAGDLAQKEAAFMLFSKFTKEVLQRMRQYKEDLLASCLMFILALPKELVVSELAAIIPALQMTFRIGQSYLPLAKDGLEALEHWSRSLSSHVMQPHYPDILPSLDAYLKSTSRSDSDMYAGDKTIALTSVNPGKRSGKRKIPAKLLQVRKEGSRTSNDSQLQQVRQHCVRLLGSLGGNTNCLLINNDARDIGQTAVSWDSTKHLKFDLPFMDIKPTIYFDDLLPRLVELAVNSSDRQTKVAACELLHSLVLYMLGRSVQAPSGRAQQNKYSMEALYRKIFPAIMQLACDVEQVAKQLFEPLLKQLIHWFTGNKKFESEETMALLDTIMDGLINPTDTALRDYSATCIREFLIWSIKQTSQKQMKKSPLNVKSLLKRIYSLAKHPSAFKRLGAALAFNNIYSIFREEESLVDTFIFEILVVFVESLALSHSDDNSLGTQEQCKVVLGHLERIMKVKANKLVDKSDTRKKPRLWPEATLARAVRWLLRHTGRPQTECRHACMELVCKLTPYASTDKNCTARDLFKYLLKTDKATYFIMRFEGGIYKMSGKMALQRRPTMADMGGTFSVKVAVNWFDMLLAALDCYCWVFGEGLLKVDQILKDEPDNRSVIFKVLIHFFDKLALGDITCAAHLFESSTAVTIFTPKETEEYNRAKCTVIVRALYFLCVLLKNQSKETIQVIPSQFWSDNLWSCVMGCVLEPMKLGFNMADVEIMMKLPEQTLHMLQVIKRYLPATIQKSFQSNLAAKLSKNSDSELFGKLPLPLWESRAEDLSLELLVSGYEQLQTAGMLSPVITAVTKGQQLPHILLDAVFKGILRKEEGRMYAVRPTPTSQTLAERLLSLAFHMGLKSSKLVEYLLDQTEVSHSGGHTSTCHGAIFFATFKTTLSKQLIMAANEAVPQLIRSASDSWSFVGSVLASLLDVAARDRTHRKKEGTDLVNVLLQHWKGLKQWWNGPMASQETQAMALTLLTKIIVIDSKVVSDGKHPAFSHVFDMYQAMLVDTGTPLTFKSRVLDLLAFFSTLSDSNLKELKTKLDRFVADNFPARSSEYPVGGPKYNDYIAAFNKILYAIELSGSVMLLEVLISIMCKEPRHVLEDHIQNSLTNYIKRLPIDKHKTSLAVAYNIFTEEKRYLTAQRKSALERVCLSLLRHVHVASLTNFFIEHIREIMRVVEAKPSKGSDAALESDLVSRLCCFELLELMFSRLSKDDVFSKKSKINETFCNRPADTGKELSSAVIKAANSIKQEDVRGETSHVELRRNLHCAAYNALIAVISCTQTEPKFYTGFLFQENIAKGQFLLDNLIDQEKQYTFAIEMDTPLARRKKFVPIRTEVRAQNETDEEDAGYHPRSVHYLASQYLADSSVSADISQFDFGNTVPASAFVSSGHDSLGSSSVSSRSSRVRRDTHSVETLEDVSTTVMGDYVEMEMDELNQHECMASMTALLQHMQRNKITPELEKGEAPTSLPSWMKYLHDKLQRSDTNRNVKLFICRLIVNAEQVFRPYAKFWLSPIVYFITREDGMDDGISYFVIDLVVTILSWHTIAIPEDNTVDRAMASRLTEFLMKHCHHETRQVLRNNLEVVKTQVEVWRDRLEIPTKVLYDYITDANKNVTGIQLVGVVLANGLAPFRTGCGVEKERFYQHLATNMSKDSKRVYAAASEVVGMALKHLSETEKTADAVEWRKKYVANVSRMLLGMQDAKPDHFITCVYKMQQLYSDISEKFLSKVLFMLPKVHGEFKTQSLEIIQNWADKMENAFIETKNKGLLDILSQRDEATQLVALKLVLSILSSLKPSELLYLMPSVAGFITHPSSVCRAKMYDILMWVYDNYRDEDTDICDQIMTITKEKLLQGLADEDLKNRLSVQNFWSHETRLPQGTLDRLVAMLEAMYSPATESQYLSYATNLLLEMTSKSPDYNREIFEHPLSECRFQDVQVSSSWRQRHAAMTPLFVETQMSQTQDVSGTVDTSLGTQQIRATQDVQQFTATQQAGTHAPYNWLTQSSLDTFATDMTMSLPTDTQSSLLFTVGAKSGAKATARASKMTVGSHFGRDRVRPKGDQVDGKEDTTDGSSQILRLRRRFIKDRESNSKYFAIKESRKKKIREEIKQEQNARREHQVTMYRRYRSGDLPDIQIKYSYIIAPLQALAQRDSGVARLLFSSVFKAVFMLIESVKTERESRETVEKINQCLNAMLANSTQYFSPFIGCMLDIAHEYPRRLGLDAATVNTACVTSMQQPLGIALLEEMLIQGGATEERPTKRQRGVTSMTQDTSKWLELARLYKSLGDYDVLLGIFSSRLGTQSLTRQAVDAEMSGDYQTAASLYSEALDMDDWGSDQPNEVEMDFWDEGRLQCYDNLTQWERLEQFTVGAFDDSQRPKLDKVWEDTYNQEHYLPFMLRSKLKLLLNDSDSQQPLLDFVDQSLKVPERKALLESRYSEELALLYTWQEDYDRARYYADNAISLFLQDWGDLDSLMASSRSAKLQTLQKLIELQEYLDYIKQEANVDSVNSARRLLQKWLERSPHPLMDSISIWDDVITNRCVYVDQISNKLETDENNELMFDQNKVRLHLCHVDAARQQDNFPVALKQLKISHQCVKGLQDEELHLQWTQAYVRTHNRRCVVADLDKETKVLALVGALDQLGKQDKCKALTANYKLGIEQNLLKGEAMRVIASQISNSRILSELADDKRQKILALAKTKKLNSEEVCDSLLEQGYQYLKHAVGLTMQEDDCYQGNRNRDNSNRNDAHLALFKYCDECLRKHEDDLESSIQCPSWDSFPTAVITSLLCAMKNGSSDARQRFPRLLQLVNYYPDTIDTFIRKTREVPSWMFLGWIGQITALLDKEESLAVQQILMTIAQDYPKALVYPFKMSDDGYHFTSDAIGKKSQSVRNSLHSILSKQRLVDIFIEALEQFGQPNELFRDWFGDHEFSKLMNSPKKNADQIQKLYREMYKALMELNESTDHSLYSDSSSLPSHVEMGTYRQKFAKKYAKKMNVEFGMDGSKLTDMTKKVFAAKTKKLYDDMRLDVNTSTLAPPGTIKEYCDFLYTFQAADYDEELEIPGQYTGQSKPMLEYHTKISSFDEKVLVMRSLRKPKRITIRGNDEKEYMFLVKGGEDLRQDQRLEQLFELMNNVFAQDPACRQRMLHIRTYQVIPMTPRLGMIEWMTKTRVLKEVQESAMTETEHNFLQKRSGKGNPREDHLVKVGAVAPEYYQNYKTYSRTDTTTAFRKREDMVPWDLLRRAYQNMSASVEAFFTLKGNFATSHGQLCICHWLLGIGDRHLSNFMVDLSTGRMVGIDFGHAFGSATQMLPIPELIPFRLTRQLRNVMHPLREKGLMEGTMIHTLRALRKNTDLLLNTMDVFIKEPSLDWKQNAVKQANTMAKAGENIEEFEQDQEWYPKQKINFAKRKLEGANPTIIMREELELGHKKSSYFKDYKKVLLGEPGVDIRAKLPHKDLTVEQQVACLLNQATDPNILGRIYVGWESWM